MQFRFKNGDVARISVEGREFEPDEKGTFTVPDGLSAKIVADFGYRIVASVRAANAGRPAVEPRRPSPTDSIFSPPNPKPAAPEPAEAAADEASVGSGPEPDGEAVGPVDAIDAQTRQPRVRGRELLSSTALKV
jgi:hypothetical protein